MRTSKKRITTPLIRLKILINDQQAIGLYDSGSNVSLINYHFWKKLNLDKDVSGGDNIKSIWGASQSDGMILLSASIGEIKKKFPFFIVKSNDFEDEILLGLDAIESFRLCQDEKLKISQKREKVIKKEIFNTNLEKNSSEHAINSVEEILKKYENVFAKSKFDIGKTKDYEAGVKLTERKFISKKPYRCSIDDKIEIENQVSELLKAGLIEESCSPFAAPVTLAYKKEDGKRSRLCNDYKELNKIVVPENHPFPRIEDLTLRAKNCKYFSKLDVNSAFWSIPLRKKDTYKTAFVTHHGHWQWRCLPFGLKSAPAIFQRILSAILRKHKLNEFAENYIDDILVFSESYEKHLIHLQVILKALLEVGFKLNLKKCKFAQTKIPYLGHLISNNCISPLNDNLISIKDFPIPKSKTQIRQFLGKINFYLEYIPRSTILLEPFHRLLRKNIDFEWSELCEENFQIVKNYLCTAPILAIFDADKPIEIYTDACIEGVGAVLKQKQADNLLKPVFYFSRKLNESQKKKRAIYIECLAIKEAILYWQYYLIGRRFRIFTDHKPLENFNVKNCKDPELIQIMNYISQFEFEIFYNPGRDNSEADSLSRNPVLKERENEDDSDSAIKTVNFLEMNKIIENQKQLKLDKNHQIENNVIYRVINNKKKIWLSEDFGVSVIKDMHHKLGHIGMKQLILMITDKFYFKNMHKLIKTICRTCDICIKNKTRIFRHKAPLAQLGPATKPFEIVSLDTIGGFLGNNSTKRYMHVLIDHFTRYAFITTSKTQLANDFIALIEKTKAMAELNIVLADQYPGINSGKFKQYLKSKNITMIFTAVDCAFSNGLNERANQTLVNRIRCKIYENKKEPWPKIAEKCVEEYNNTIHSSTGFTLNYLLTGSDSPMFPDEISNKEDKLKDNRLLAFERSKKIHEQNKGYYDKNSKRFEYKINDLVYIQNGNKVNKNKLDPIREGPYKIKEKLSELIFIVECGLKKKESNLFHASKLIPYSPFLVSCPS